MLRWGAVLFIKKFFYPYIALNWEEACMNLYIAAPLSAPPPRMQQCQALIALLLLDRSTWVGSPFSNSSLSSSALLLRELLSRELRQNCELLLVVQDVALVGNSVPRGLVLSRSRQRFTIIICNIMLVQRSPRPITANDVLPFLSFPETGKRDKRTDIVD